MKNFLQRHKRSFCIYGPILISLVFVVLCIAQLNQSIWFDESYGAYIARFKFSDIVHFTSNDVHPPLYYFALKTWAHFFGYNIISMRLLSVFFGAFAILFAFKWLKYKYGAKVAFIGSFALAINPFIVRYGQEMRMYTLVLLIFFAATYFMQLAIDTKKKLYWIIYGILVAAGMWTHYFTAFAWCAQLVYILSIYKLDFFKKKLFLVYVLAILLFAPWFPALLSQVRCVQQGFWIPEISVKSLVDLWTEFTVYSSSDNNSNWTTILTLLNILVFAYIIAKTHKKQRYLSFLAVIPIIMLVIISLPPLKSMFVSRYLYYSAACVAMLPAVGFAILFYNDKSLRKKNPHKRHKAIRRYSAMGVILLATSLFGLSNLYRTGNLNPADGVYPTAKQLYESIVDLSAEEEAIVVSGKTPVLIFDLGFYSTNEHPVLFLNEEMDYKYGSFLPPKESYFGRIDNFDQFKSENPSFWYVGEGLDPDKDVPENFEIIEEASLQFHDKGQRYTLWKLQSTEL